GLLFVESAIDQITHLPNHFSERADEITARLLALVAGEEPPAQAAWMGEIAHQAQQRQTMATLVGEMQTSLRQVEKTLDDYFRESGKPELLVPVAAILHQIGGAMAILDQDDAQRAIEYTRNKIAEFAQHDDAQTQQGNYQNVAQNIGALSFFIETLQTQPDQAKKKFVFDAEQGLFRSNLLEKASDKSLLPHASMALDQTSAAPTSSEDELALQQIESARLASTLAAQPDNLDIQAQLKDSLASEVSVAAILDDADASARAQSAIELLEQVASGDSADSSEAVNEIIAVTSAEKTDHSAVQSHALSSPLPASDEAIDAELLEIFLTEADEVLGFVNQTVPVSRLDPSNQEHLTSLRRSFHTLKGSGRMVGLTVFGEAAWSVEQVMNLWLSEGRSGTEALYDLLDYVAIQLTQWVDDLKATGVSRHDADAIVAAAELVKAGLEFKADAIAAPVVLVEPAEPTTLPENTTETDVPAISLEAVDIGAAALAEFDALMAAQVADAPVAVSDVAEETVDLAVSDSDFNEAKDALAPEPESASLQADGLVIDAEALADDEVVDKVVDKVTNNQEQHQERHQDVVSADIINLADTANAGQAGKSAGDENGLKQMLNSAEIIDFPALQALTVPLDDTIKRIGSLEISLPLHTIYMSETDEIVRYLAQEFAEWRHEPARTVARHAVHAAHSLAGSSATVGLQI
ncbi:MAG: Hpt domain-containing protein, partial [Burkholderiaceae bacterium]|nr:Hpt domain-containing protein [Burkholderiaceae bacterium]